MKRFFGRIAAILVFIAVMLYSMTAFAVGPGFTVKNGSRDSSMIAITIDDCYNKELILEALALAEQYQVKLTFFPLGNQLSKNDRELWQAVLDGGHEIGSHSYSHPVLPDQSRQQILYQLTRTQEALDDALGWHYPMRYLRPPYGRMNKTGESSYSGDFLNLIEYAGHIHSILWDVSQTDPALAVNAVNNGSILLYHTNAKDIRCLEVLIPELKQRGFEMVTVSTLLGLEPLPIEHPGAVDALTETDSTDKP